MVRHFPSPQNEIYTVCTIATVCNIIIAIIAVCRKSSKTSLICSVKPLIMIFVMMIMRVSIHSNKGCNLEMRGHVAWTNNDEIIGWFIITMSLIFIVVWKEAVVSSSLGGWIRFAFGGFLCVTELSALNQAPCAGCRNFLSDCLTN